MMEIKFSGTWAEVRSDIAHMLTSLGDMSKVAASAKPAAGQPDPAVEQAVAEVVAESKGPTVPAEPPKKRGPKPGAKRAGEPAANISASPEDRRDPAQEEAASPDADPVDSLFGDEAETAPEPAGEARTVTVEDLRGVLGTMVLKHTDKAAGMKATADFIEKVTGYARKTSDVDPKDYVKLMEAAEAALDEV